MRFLSWYAARAFSACALIIAHEVQANTGAPEDAAPISETTAAATSQPGRETLAGAIAAAYARNPLLAAQRYELRAIDDQLGMALSQTRPTVRAEVSTGYRYTSVGDITQAKRPLIDQLNSPNIHENDIVSQIVVDQPIITGGKATADIAAARGDIRAGQQRLRGHEGDLLLEVVTAYVNIRRDSEALAIRRQNEVALAAILDEVGARREAGELTRTDVAQATTQLQSARTQLNSAEAQLQDSRSSFSALVGHDPGELAPQPQLPALPATIDDMFDLASRFNPDLAAAIESERASGARIASARSERRPVLSLRGAAGTTGPVAPFYGSDQDLYWSGRLTVTLPLSAGGRTASNIAQALDRNSADRLRIEGARRRMIWQLTTAWNQMATARRNYLALADQVQAARIYHEGTLEEYRAGLRSTFDVLYAQNALRESEIGLLGAQRDEYVAHASVLRQLGELEAGKLLSGVVLYDADAHVRKAASRGALPWDQAIQAIDRLSSPGQTRQAIAALRQDSEAKIVSNEAMPAPTELIRQGPPAPQNNGARPGEREFP